MEINGTGFEAEREVDSAGISERAVRLSLPLQGETKLMHPQSILMMNSIFMYFVKPYQETNFSPPSSGRCSILLET